MASEPESDCKNVFFSFYMLLERSSAKINPQISQAVVV